VPDFWAKMVHDYFLGIVMKHPKPKNTSNSILRKHLNADALFRALHTDFSKVADFRQGDVKIETGTFVHNVHSNWERGFESLCTLCTNIPVISP